MTWKPKISREAFIEQYAKASGMSSEFADLGFATKRGMTKFALPCSCADGCDGWQMISSVERLDHYFQFDAPENIRDAFEECLTTEETET